MADSKMHQEKTIYLPKEIVEASDGFAVDIGKYFSFFQSLASIEEGSFLIGSPSHNEAKVLSVVCSVPFYVPLPIDSHPLIKTLG